MRAPFVKHNGQVVTYILPNWRKTTNKKVFFGGRGFFCKNHIDL